MSLNRAIVALCMLAMLASLPAAAQDFKVRAFLDPQDGFTDARQIRLLIQIEGTDNPQVSAPRLPPLKNLSLISGPNTKTNLSWIDGQTTSTHQISYTLMPNGPGEALIPAIEVRVGGQTFRTDPFRIEVVKAPAARAGPGKAARGSGARGTDPEALFLDARLGTEEIWVGQPVPLTVTLYTQPRVSGFVWRSQPDFANFWVEPVEFDIDADAYRTRIAGKLFTAYPVDRRVLIAPGPGEYILEPYVGQVQVHVNRDDPFDWFRFGRSETVLRRSEGLKLTVRPLPADGKPANFSGAVGSYEMQVLLDRHEARVDDAVALSATVRGEGALRSVGAPALEAPHDVKVFEPQVKESLVRTRNGKIVSTKTWEWILVPLKPGNIQVPELRFEYFDPQQAAYRAATSQPLELAVVRGDAIGDTPVPGGPRAVQARRDLAFIKPLRGALRETSPRAHERGLFRLLLFLPVALAPLVIVLGRHRARLSGDQGLARFRRARARARKAIQATRSKIEQPDSATFHETVARTLVEYLADRANRSAAGLTYDAADELLAARDVDPELRRRYRTCLERCDFVRFVPEASHVERRAEVLDEAESIIEALEKAW